MELQLVINIDRYFSLLEENGSRLVFEHGEVSFLDLSRIFFTGVLYRNMIDHTLFTAWSTQRLISLTNFVGRESISNYLSNVRKKQSDLSLRSDEFVDNIGLTLSELELVDETRFENTSRNLLRELFNGTFILEEFENNHRYLYNRLESQNLTSDLIQLYDEFHSSIRSITEELYSLTVDY